MVNDLDELFAVVGGGVERVDVNAFAERYVTAHELALIERDEVRREGDG